MTSDDLLGRFWWPYACGGVLGWLAVGFVWWRTSNFEFAFDVVCRGVGGLASWVGYALAMFWLASTALMVGLGLIVVPFMAVVWIVQRHRARSN